MGSKSHSRQYEDRLVKSFEDMMKNIISTETKFNGEMMKSTAAMTKWLSILSNQNKLSEDRIKVSNKDYKKSQEQLRVKEKLKKADEYLVNLRHKLNIEQEREHGQQVRRNIVLRANMDSFNDKFNMLKKSLTGGFGFQAGMNKTVTEMGRLTRNFQENKIASEKLKKATDDEISAKKLAGIAYISGDEADQKLAGDEWKIANRQLESAKDAAEEAAKKAEPTQGKAKPIFERLNKLGEFLNKKAVPIGLGVGAAGVLISVITKSFSASPLFAQMMKLLKFSVQLILMPIGTFFGALLRPILITLLRKFIIPFYSTWMPILMKLGGDIGTWITTLTPENIAKSLKEILFPTNPTKLDEIEKNKEIRKESNKVAQNEFTKDPLGFIWRLFDLPTVDNVLPPSAAEEQEATVDWDMSGENPMFNGKTPSDITSSSGNEYMSTWASSGNLLGKDEYKNPVTANAESVLTKNQKMIQRYINNPDIIAQEQNFKNAINTGGVISETVKEVVKSINPNTGLVSHIRDAGANITSANARNASAGYTMGGSAKSQSILEAYNAFKNGVSAANGFDGMVNSPTMFLAGEAGAEHVTVTPNGQGGGSNITINIQNMNGSDNDLRRLKKTILEVIQESSANRGRL